MTRFRHLLTFALVFFRGVTPEVTRRGEFAEFMAYHVLSDVHRDELVAIMNCERVAYEIRRNHRATRPGFDDRFLARIVLRLDLIV